MLKPCSALDRLVDAQRALRRLDVQVLDHPAVVGDHARAPAVLPGLQDPAGVLDRLLARRERLVGAVDLAGVDQGLAVEAHLAALPALGEEARRGPSRRCRRRRGSPCRRRGPRAARAPRPVSSGCAARARARRTAPWRGRWCPSPARRGARRPPAISSACSIAYGVSTIAHSLVCSGAPWPLHRVDEREHRVGAVDLGHDDRVAGPAWRRREVVGVPLGVGAVDPDRQLAAAVLTRARPRRRRRRGRPPWRPGRPRPRGRGSARRTAIVLAFSSARSLELGM